MKQLRGVAHVIAWLSLLAVALRPTWRRPVATGEAVLITPGADAAQVRRLVDSLGGVPVYTDPNDIPTGPVSVRRLHVVGWGLEPERWAELDPRAIDVTVHPTGAPAGFTRVVWTTHPALGEGLEIEGRVGGVPRGAMVALLDPAGRVDSARIGEDGVFHIDAQPSGTGRQLYVLQAGSIAPETLAVDVMTPPERRMLILAGTPTFETVALRDWLARRGGQIAIRTAVSRDRYRTEFVNRDRGVGPALTPLTERLLSQFDIVQIDGRSLAGLTAAERATLRRAVTERGLGMLIVPDTVVFDRGLRFSDRDFFLDFALRRVGDLEDRNVRPAWGGATLRAAPTPVVSAPYALEDRFGVEALMSDGAGGTAAQVATRGAGRVGISLVQGSGRWLRNGRRDLYAAYWSTLLAAVSGDRSHSGPFVETAGPWLAHQAMEIGTLEPNEPSVAVVRSPSGILDSVFLAPDRFSPEEGRGVYWPRETGWHTLSAAGGARGQSFYVQSAAAWRARQASERLDTMARHVMAQPEARPDLQTASVPIPRIWFFGLFVFSAAVLWSARRPAASFGGNATGVAS